MNHFPENFIWGSATAAHQVEGGNFNSDCWALEHARPSMFREPSGEAVDQWNRFADDVAILAGIGLNSYRFGIEWARIEPEQGSFSSAAIDHYQRCIDACLERGVQPMLTFHHFTSPRWVAREGGMTNSAFPDRFARYCEHVARALRGFSYACTINELNVPVLVKNLTGALVNGPNGCHLVSAAEAALSAPVHSFFLLTPREALLANGLAAHAKGRDAIKAVRPEAQVGLTLSLQEERSESGAEAVLQARLDDYVTPFLDGVRGDDFIGVQTYTRYVSRADGSYGPETGQALTTMGFQDCPEALAAVCRHVWEVTRTPIIVTENGWAGDNDARREAFILKALESLQDAIADGVDVRGYYYWTLLDNFEWFSGYSQRFGLIGVDRTSQRRLIKPSALTYGRIAQANSIGITTATEPAPESFPEKSQVAAGAPLGIG